MIKNINSKILKNLLLTVKTEKPTVLLTIVLSVILSVVQIAGLSVFLPVIHILEGKSNDAILNYPVVGQILSFFPENPKDAIVPLIILMFIMISLRGGLQAYIQILKTKIKNYVDGSWQRKALDHWMGLTALQHTRENQSKIMHLVSREISNIGRAGAATIGFFSSCIQILITMIFMLMVSSKVVILIVGFVLFVMLPLSFLVKKMFEIAQRDASMLMKYTSRIFDVIKRIALIDIHAKREKERTDLVDFLNKYLKARIDLQKVRVVGPFMVQFLGAALICSLVLYFYFTGESQGLNQLILLVGSLVIISPQVALINDTLSEIARVDASIEQVNTLLNVPHIHEKYGSNESLSSDHDIVLKDVHFSYATEEGELKVLDDVSVVLPGGKLTMIFGASGAGKTTLLHVLKRLYPINLGSIEIGQANINDFEEKAWSQMVTLMPQDNIIFSGTVRENISYGNPGASDKELWEAIKISKAKDFIARQDKGLDSEVGSDGDLFSGGQKQRLALARVMASKAPIILFDEPTSHLDRYTEIEVLKNLKKLKDQGSTLVVSTHKIELAPLADHLLWFENGKLFEGSFEEFKSKLQQLDYEVVNEVKS